MECRKGRRKGFFCGLLFAWLFTSACTAAARNYERYDTAYACDGKTLQIQCPKGKLIHLVRANYGRYSITICNENGQTDWSVNCMSPASVRVLEEKCSQKQNCSVEASAKQFGDPCPGTLKYLEAHYQCTLAATIPTTSRPAPPWLITTEPSVWSTPKTNVRPPTRVVTPTTPPATTSTVAVTPSPSYSANSTQVDSNNVESEADVPNNAHGHTPSSASSDTVATTTTTTVVPWRTSRVTTTSSTYYPESSSREGLRGNSDSEQQYCPSIYARNLNWPSTPLHGNVSQQCPEGSSGDATWKCVGRGGTAVWSRGTPDLSKCESAWIQGLKERLIINVPILKISEEMSRVTNDINTFYGGDINATTYIIKSLARKMKVTVEASQDREQNESNLSDLIRDVVKTGSNLLDKAPMASWRDLPYDQKMTVATSLLVGLEDHAFLLAENLVTKNQFIREEHNILMDVRVLDTRNIHNDLEVFPKETMQRSTPSNRIELTKNSIIGNSERGMVKMVFMEFDRLEEILQPHNDLSAVDQPAYDFETPLENTSRIINSKIVSAALSKARHVQLSEPVRVYFRHLRMDNVTNPVCVYWNYNESFWSTDGCDLTETNSTHSVCQCNHLTNFAILMDVYAVKLNTAHQVALQIITYIGCIISIVCLVLAILTFQVFRGLKSDRTTIHKNLCVCLFIAELLFVCGIGQTNQRIVCGVVAGLLHFFFLCSFAWMFLEGFQLYVLLIEVFEAEKSRLRWYYLGGYGIPLLVVAISCIIDPLSYGTDQHCWLRTDNYFIFSFVGPVILVILANFVFLSMAIYMMCRHANTTVSMKSKEHSRLASARVWLRGAITLMFLLGLTWTFGLLYLSQESVVMAYIFTVLNSLQGLFIFVFYCVQNEKVRKEYRKFIRRHSWLPKCLRCSKTVSGSGGGTTGSSGIGTGANGGKDFNSHNTSSNPSAPNTDSSGLSQPHAASNYLVSGRGWPITDRQPTHESSTSEAHNVATLPHARHAFFPSAPNSIPKSATATWGPFNKKLMWKQNISFKSCSRDSGHGGSEQEDSPRTHSTMTLQGYPGERRGRRGDEVTATAGVTTRTGSRRAASPFNHTYTEIRDGRHHHQLHGHHHPHHHLSRGLVGEDDPVYEEIERGIGPGAGIAGEIQVSDMSDEDGRRQSDMSRQSSRSYSDARPLIPYSPANERTLGQYGQAPPGDRYDPLEQDRVISACWEKFRRQPRYEMGELPRGYGVPQQDHTRTVAVLDGQTVVCHLQPQTDMYTGRGVPPPSYSEC